MMNSLMKSLNWVQICVSELAVNKSWARYYTSVAKISKRSTSNYTELLTGSIQGVIFTTVTAKSVLIQFSRINTAMDLT